MVTQIDVAKELRYCHHHPCSNISHTAAKKSLIATLITVNQHILKFTLKCFSEQSKNGTIHLMRFVVRVTVGKHLVEICNALFRMPITTALKFLLNCSHIHRVMYDAVIILK